MIITTKSGKKLYPVANWERNEHKIFAEQEHMMYIINCAVEDKDFETVNKVSEKLDRLETAMAYSVYDGLIYAEYPAYKILKATIADYNIRH